MKNTFVKVLSMMMALMMVVGILTVVPATAAGCNHTKGELVEEKSKEPTCIAWGYSTYICGLCGEEWETDAVAPTAANHSYVDQKEVPADCFTNYISAGKKCEYCGKVLEGCKEVAGTRLDHQFVGEITPATCTTNKKLVYTCKICNKDAETIKDKGLYIGYTEGDSASKTAWLTKYNAEWKFVEYAGTALNANHADLEWTMVVSPSCTPGKAEGFCKKCNQVIRETVIPAIHSTPYEVNPHNHSCAEYPAGVYKCSVCQAVLTPNAQKNPNYGKHTATTPVLSLDVPVNPYNLPTKPVTGGKFSMEELRYYGYDVNQILGKKPTCTTEGYQLVQCACGAIFNETIEKANHNYGGAGYTYVNPTNCTEAYYKTRTCITPNCGYKDTVILAAAANAGHNMVVVPSNTPGVAPENKSQDATCTQIGYTYRKCTNVDCMGNACGAFVKDTYVDPNGHAWGNPYWVSGSCDASPVYNKKCSVCNTPEVVPASQLTAAQKAHAWGAEVTVAPTCQEPEYKYVPCTVCGAWKDNPTKTHNYTQGSQKNPANHVYASAAELKAFVEAYDNDKTHTSDDALGIIGFNGSKKSSCTVAGELNIKCKYCSMDTADSRKTVAAPKADHDYVLASKANYNNSGAFTGLTTTAIPVKCNQTGYNADGEFCVECGNQKKAPTTIGFNAAAATLDQMEAYHNGTITWHHV